MKKFCKVTSADSLLAFLITFLHIAGWQISMDMGSSVHQTSVFQKIGVMEIWQCVLWGIVEWIFLNLLFSRMFAALAMRTERDFGGYVERKYIHVCSFFVLLAIWYFFLWCCYPGYYNYDVGNQLVQVLYEDIPYSAHHPLLHTLLSGGLITLGYHIRDTDLVLGVLLDNMVQMFLLAGALSYALRYLYERSRSFLLTALSFCFYAFCPPIVMFAMSPTKDVLCYAFLLISIIRLREIYRKTTEGKSLKVWEWILCGIFILLSCLMRKNIIYAVVVFSICSVAMIRKEYKKQMHLFLGVYIAYMLINQGLLIVLDANPDSINEALCVPYQSMARLYVQEGKQAFTDEEYELLSQIIPPDNLRCYDPVIADAIKANFNQGLDILMANKWDYIKLWIKKGLEYPDIYLNAFLYNTYQAWYPGTAIVDNTGIRYFDITEWDDEFNTPNWQGLYDYYRDIRWGEYAKYPIVRLLFVPGTMFWIVLITWFYGIYRKDKSLILSFLLILLVCGTTFLGPVSDVRYYLILFYVMPVCLGMLFERNAGGRE